MLHYPNINPVAFKLGPLQVHWYGLMYLIGFAGGWLLACWRAKNQPWRGWNCDQVSDLLFYVALGVILGGRIGYMLFYEFSVFWQHPTTLFRIWDGGMSFHGGFLGVAVALAWFSYRSGKSFFAVADFMVPVVPIGLAAGRIGNFINGELWGRVSSVPWAMQFPGAGPLPRHPSQLYEFFFEGVVLFIVLWLYSAKKRPAPSVSALFLFLYGCFRFMLEFLRQPDPQLGFVALGWLTRGQELSIPMVLAGLLIFIWAHKRGVHDG